jgi:acetyl-CoA C-acetyltransferase
MSMVPILCDALDGAAAGHGEPITDRYREHWDVLPQLAAAERIAEKYGVSRTDSDALGLLSQTRARHAVDGGHFASQIIPVRTGAGEFTVDEVPRDTTLEALAALDPLEPGCIHTAGTASKIADAASAVLIMTAERAAELGMAARARVVDTTLVGCDPVLMLEGPIPATRRVLDRTGLVMGDIDVVEINEAFAAIVLAWAGELKPDMDRVNPNGGAIAFGHALGSTGALLITKAVNELERADGEYALVTMCCGGGLGTATVLQRL